ncbi:MAG TPA: hypothetical protein DEO43_02160 [Halieaceae bacterium]|nr:hypothetical protein [Halieaceae bacterium]
MKSLISRHPLKGTAAACLCLLVGCGGSGSGSSSEPGIADTPPQTEQPNEENSFTPFKIEIQTPVEGAVTTTSTAIECAANQNCTVDVTDIFFDETFVADPAPGWLFAGWKQRDAGLCGGNSTPCTIDTTGWAGNPTLEGWLADPTFITYLEPEFVVERTTKEIAMAGEQTITQSGFTIEFDFYRNSAYECGLSGNYTFMVLNPANGSADDEAPLWVYLHGGGVGHYDDQGNYYAVLGQTEDTWNNEETFQDLQNTLSARILNNGQPINNTLTRRIQEGYRTVVVSMCDHDLYSGLGTPYPNNPNPDAEVNGMQATMSAVDYVVANYPTTEVWAHGSSAGSTGTYNLAMSYVAEGIHLTGAVPDSIFPTPRAIPLTAAYGGDPSSPYQLGFDSEAVVEKMGFYGDLSRNAHPEARIAAGFTDVPFLFVGGRNDPFCNHNLPAIPEALAEGINHNCDYYHEGLSQVIAAQPDSPHQLAYIQDRGHVPTLDAGPVNNTVDTFISDIQAGNPAAPFRVIPGDKMMLMGHSFFRPFADEMPYHAIRAGVDGHSQNVEFSGGASGAPLALWNDAVHRANIQAVLNAGDVDVFGMTCCDWQLTPGGDPVLDPEGNPILSLEGWQLWFDYALAQNPDTEFFIGIPWFDYPTDYADAEAYADLWNLFYNTLVLPAVDDLRALYPGVTIYSIPYGQAVNELRAMFEAGNIPELANLEGPGATSLFTDYKGHGGQLLKDLVEYVWMDAIYGVDLDKYAHDDGYQTDLKALAKSIMDAHNPDYNGPNR